MSEAFLEELEDIIILLRDAGTKAFEYSSTEATVHLAFDRMSAPQAVEAAVEHSAEASIIRSPAIGYVQFTQPGLEDPLSELDASVARDQTVAIIAFDSFFISVKSPVAGRITAIHASEGERVGYDDPLITVTACA